MLHAPGSPARPRVAAVSNRSWIPLGSAGGAALQAFSMTDADHAFRATLLVRLDLGMSRTSFDPREEVLELPPHMFNCFFCSSFSVQPARENVPVKRNGIQRRATVHAHRARKRTSACRPLRPSFAAASSAGARLEFLSLLTRFPISAERFCSPPRGAPCVPDELFQVVPVGSELLEAAATTCAYCRGRRSFSLNDAAERRSHPGVNFDAPSRFEVP